MSITQQGATKTATQSGGVATIVFDSTPASGDLLLFCAIAATTGPTVASGGASALSGAQGTNGAGNRFAYWFYKIAGAGESNSYGFNTSGTGSGVVAYCFRATNGFKATPECTAAVSPGTTTTVTLDPAGVPSGASSVVFAGFNSGSSSNTSATLAFDGGSTQAFDTEAAGRSFAGFKIETSVPADSKAVWASLASASSHTGAMAVFVEATGATTHLPSTNLSGVGAGTYALTRIKVPATTLTGLGSSTQALTRVRRPAAALTGTGAGTFAMTKELILALAASGVGSMSPALTRVRTPAVSLTGTSDLVVGLARVVNLALFLDSIGQLTPSMVKSAVLAADLSGGSDAIALMVRSLVFAANLSSTGLLLVHVEPPRLYEVRAALVSVLGTQLEEGTSIDLVEGVEVAFP